MKRFLLIALLLPAFVHADVLVKWTPPIDRLDGTKLSVTEIAGYEVRKGNVPIIRVSGSVTSQVYKTAASRCIRKTDPLTIVVTTKDGLVSPPSAPIYLDRDDCGSTAPTTPATKTAPKAPSSVSASIV